MKLITAIITLLACALLVISLAGCGEEREDIHHLHLPTLYLTEHNVDDQFVYAITSSEPLPYPVDLTINISATMHGSVGKVIALHTLRVCLASDSQAWYGFYSRQFVGADPSSGVVFFDWANGSIKSYGIKSTYKEGFFRRAERATRQEVSEITVTISHPDEPRCGSRDYYIGVSEIAIKRDVENVR